MNLSERLSRHLGKTPDLARAAFVAANATVVGDVTLGQGASVWYGCVLRGDINSIVIGDGSNVQDGTIVHLADDYGVRVGNHTTIGHAAIIHACDIGDECLIGMGATVLDGAKIGDRCIVGANALVTQRFVAPPGSMILGAPAKVVRPLTAAEQAGLRHWAEKYVEVAGAHAAAQPRSNVKNV
ncbi:MAG: gamma carbonic anhydrase family protein [Verrucomicrobia bacterium]|nr:gamma carbonic anhydrase family protein [Verrucomicrobiota bacterium]